MLQTNWMSSDLTLYVVTWLRSAVQPGELAGNVMPQVGGRIARCLSEKADYSRLTDSRFEAAPPMPTCILRGGADICPRMPTHGQTGGLTAHNVCAKVPHLAPLSTLTLQDGISRKWRLHTRHSAYKPPPQPYQKPKTTLATHRNQRVGQGHAQVVLFRCELQCL